MINDSALMQAENFFTHLIEHYAVELPEMLTLESAQDFIYLSDLETYELYFLGMANAEQLHKEWANYKGQKCYKVLQGRDKPCSFCTNHLLEKELDYIWRFRNPVIDREYILKDRLVDWNGKTVRMEIVTEISDAARISTVLERTLESQNILAGCLRHLADAKEIEEGCSYVLQKVGNFLSASYGAIECIGMELIRTQWLSKDTANNKAAKNHPPIPPIYLCKQWEPLLGNNRQIVIRDVEELRETDFAFYQVLSAENIHSLLSTPIFISGHLSGFIHLVNVSRNWTEIPILSMISSFLSKLMERDVLEQERTSLLLYDPLTNSLNFEGFRRAVPPIIERNPYKKYALWYCDIRNFKYINDVFGYDVGDNLLRFWAVQLGLLSGEDDVYGRIAGDNFAILHEYQAHTDLETYFRKMLDALSSFEHTRNMKYRLDIVAGVYPIQDDEMHLSVMEMLNRANMAQKTVKTRAGSNWAYYDETVRRNIIRDMQIEAEMEEALRQREFVLYLQPQIALDEAGGVLRAEALVRWRKPDGRIILPGEFIDLFERDGMIVALDRYIFEQACAYLRAWEDAGRPTLSLAVNVSRISMLQPDFVDTYRRIKEQYHIPDDLMELEFTETVVIENYEQFAAIVRRLKDYGFLSAMDDFGTCQSSLNLLRNLPLDVLKLDRLFFLPDGNPARGKAVVGCILQLAQALQMHTVAEGIETLPLVEDLREMGCDRIQGYIFARPMPCEDFLALPESELQFYRTGQK